MLQFGHVSIRYSFHPLFLTTKKIQFHNFFITLGNASKIWTYPPSCRNFNTRLVTNRLNHISPVLCFIQKPVQFKWPVSIWNARLCQTMLKGFSWEWYNRTVFVGNPSLNFYFLWSMKIKFFQNQTKKYINFWENTWFYYFQCSLFS